VVVFLVPSASPLPRSPSVLVLGHADELLTGRGCPVCRYVSEASEHYLTWFALEAHADAVMLAGLTASLGMCPRHTRRLIGQPGAATRLTAVYLYVIRASAKALTARGWRPRGCPACQHDTAAADRALDILLYGVGAAGFRERYQEAGGLCIPHVRAAAVRCRRPGQAWLAQVALIRLDARPASAALLAGDLDQDADTRTRMRAALPPPGAAAAGSCAICRAAAHVERARLEQAAHQDILGAQPSPELCLCAVHLQDAVITAGRAAQALLAWQAGCQAAGLARLASASPRRGGLTWRGAWRRRPPAGMNCPVCRDYHDATRGELEHQVTGRASGDADHAESRLCVRHVLRLQAADAGACPAMTTAAVNRAGALGAELAEAFRKDTWGHRREARGAEMTAWLRAAAFVDGAVFGGCPGHQLRDSRTAASYQPDGTPAGPGAHDV
jgi:hypothetical protein